MATGWEAWESYFYPETYDPATQQGTLQNKFGERDAHRLDIRERAASAARAQQLGDGLVDIERSFGIEHLQAIHRHLFQDVYDWAGDQDMLFSRLPWEISPRSSGWLAAMTAHGPSMNATGSARTASSASIPTLKDSWRFEWHAEPSEQGHDGIVVSRAPETRDF